MMRFAYADPPYVGQAERLYGDHPDYAGEVDHHALIEQLRTFDGWALSASMKSLPYVLGLCPPDVLTLAWVKPDSAPPMGDHRHYSWEPLILHGGRRPTTPTRTHLVASTDRYAFRPKPTEYVVGAKPRAFCYWLFAAAGLDADDEFTDLFPGSGAVGHAWEAWRAQGRLHPPASDAGGA